MLHQFTIEIDKVFQFGRLNHKEIIGPKQEENGDNEMIKSCDAKNV